MSLVRFRKSSMTLFNISVITSATSSIATDGYKFITSKEVLISLGDIFHCFASSANEDEFIILCLILFKVGYIVGNFH